MSKNKIIIGSLIFLIIVYAIIHIESERKANSLINPEIYPAFRRIENHALLYVERKLLDRDEYERCKMVVDRMGKDFEISNRNPDYFISAEEYYNFLVSLGFKLPQFRLSAPPTKEQEQQSMMEQKRLLKIQNEIIEKQLKRYFEELEEEFKP